jgi:ferrochelatase
MAAEKRIAIVLFQLGGPDTQEAVEPFLYNLFCDPDIINFPGSFLARKPLAKLISTTRSKKVRQHYAEIGGGSPIRRLTEQQAINLERALRPHIAARTIVAMRYWHPNTNEAVAALESAPYDELVLLPLYPHYSFATTGSSLKEWHRLYKPKVPVQRIDHFYLPMVLVEKGDPYPKHIAATVELVRELGAFPNPHVLCFQSKVGPQKWLEPSLTGTIAKLTSEGVRRMLVIPIAFLTDHIETLHEINIQGREFAHSLGVEDFYMTPGLNDSSLLTRAMADLVLRAVGHRSGVASLAL